MNITGTSLSQDPSRLVVDQPETGDPGSARGAREASSPVRGGTEDDVEISLDYLERILSDRIGQVMGHFGRRRGLAAVDERFDGPSGPVRLARRLAGEVEQALAEALDTGEKSHELSRLVRAARKAIQKTFKALIRPGRSRGQDIDQAYRRLGDALDALDRSVSAGEATEALSLSREISARATRSLALEIHTREGDVVAVAVEASFAFRSNTSVSGTEDSLSLHAERERVEQVALSYRVEGHLSEKELEAVDRLVRQAQRLANGLFRGDVAGALKRLGGIELEASPIASFSIDLSGSLETELAIA